MTLIISIPLLLAGQSPQGRRHSPGGLSIPKANLKLLYLQFLLLTKGMKKLIIHV